MPFLQQLRLRSNSRDQSKSGSFHACYTVEIQDKKIPLKSIDFVLFGFDVYEIYDKLLG